jgi:hypothetical protein
VISFVLYARESTIYTYVIQCMQRAQEHVITNVQQTRAAESGCDSQKIGYGKTSYTRLKNITT